MSKYSGKSLILVAGGLLQQTAVKIAHELGLYVIVTDKNPECACAKLADEFCLIDTKDIEGHIKLAHSLKNLAGIFTEGASVEMTVAGVAEELGLPGIDYNTAKRIANKSLMRVRLLNAGLSSVHFAVYDRWERFVDEYMTFPCILKATDSSGSRGVFKAYQFADVTKEQFEHTRSVSSDGLVLVEELLQPDSSEEITEQSVETVWYNGKGNWLNWVDRPFLGSGKYAIELGHYNPALHSPEKQQKVEQLVLAAGKVLGMSNGIFKADVMLTNKGARILETTARLSGGGDCQFSSPLAHGVNYIRGAMKLALGEEIDWDDFMPRQYRHAVALAAFPRPGKITNITKDVPDDVLVFSRVHVGDIIPEYTTCVDRPLFVVTSGNSRQEAVGKAKDALSKIKIETR